MRDVMLWDSRCVHVTPRRLRARSVAPWLRRWRRSSGAAAAAGVRGQDLDEVVVAGPDIIPRGMSHS